MEDDQGQTPSINLKAVEQPVQNSKTFRLKLATSLRLHAERVASIQGVSVGYLIVKAIEEKIARTKSVRAAAQTGEQGVHLVRRKVTGEGV